MSPRGRLGIILNGAELYVRENNFKYVPQHELFHFIQKEGSSFEKLPTQYENVLNENIKIFLLEEAFVQYFTARINNKTPEYFKRDEKDNIKNIGLMSVIVI